MTNESIPTTTTSRSSQLFGFLLWVRSHPLIHIVLAAFSTVAAVFVGVLGEIGFDFLPLINAADMLLQIGAYASFLSLFILLARAMWASSYNATAGLPGSSIKFNLSLLDSPYFRKRFIIASAVLFLSSIASWLYLRIYDPSLAIYARTVGAVILLIIPTIGYFVFDNKSTKAACLGGISTMYIVFMIVLGQLYTKIIRDEAPRVQIELVSSEKLQATIAFRAMYGFIVFVDGSPHRAEYLPSSSIKMIRGRLRQDPL